ncbi:hypothetical protein [Sphingobacterium detergens]|uniref:Fimbrillin-like protein n=1 Tax=Sphingobacterium detergens TaxID=1145106 RepID=A0A420BK60_SPHD1|nr:hypothetical protein [Sphingobacterium detergens]RKE57102.1 hypothetical protein DFQ12_1978 [Sphingobacterium detergens]
MKMLRAKRLSWTAASIALVLASSTTFLSCSKEREQVEETAQLEGTKLVLNVSGIDEGQNIGTKGAVNGTSASKPSSAKVVEFPEFDAVLAVDNNVPFKASQRVVRAASNSSSTGVRAAAIDNGVKYRLYLFSQDGTQLISSTLFTSGTQGTIDVQQGTTYKWVALSYNTGEDVPDITSGNTKINLPAGKDILYATGVTTVPTGGTTVNVPINIAFKHKFARLGVELNSQGMFANMSGAKVAVAGLKTATIDVATGGLSDLVAADLEIPFATFTDIDLAYQDAKIAYAYTADPAAVSGGIKVAVSNLALKIDNGTTRQFSATPVNFVFNVTPSLGNSQRLLVNLIESPLTIDGVRWARQNIYYQAGHNPYRFHHTYAHSNARNTFFSFKGLVPDQFGKNSDPCAEVYPAGIWRTASENDFRKLTGFLGIGAKKATYGSTNNRGYAEYDATGVAAPYPNNKLHFNFNGESTSFAFVNGIVQVNLGNFGTNAEFWTGSAGVDLGGLAGFGAWYYHADRGLFNTVNADLTASVLNVSVIGVDFIQTQMRNIRCVRN